MLSWWEEPGSTPGCMRRQNTASHACNAIEYTRRRGRVFPDFCYKFNFARCDNEKMETEIEIGTLRSEFFALRGEKFDFEMKKVSIEDRET